MDIKFDFSGIEAELSAMEDAVRHSVEQVGREAVEYAVENGDYQDRTGRLRASTRAEVTSDGLQLTNSAPYASYVESKGFDVVSGAALYAESRLKEVFG